MGTKNFTKDKKMSKNKLKEYEEFCDKCEGYGTLRKQWDPGAGALYPCDKCKGTGKLDWLEKIYGKKEFDPFEHFESIVFDTERYLKTVVKELASVQPITEVKIDVEKEEYKCTKCDETGNQNGDFTFFNQPQCVEINDVKIRVLCPYCGGTGKIDWLQRIFKKSKLNENEIHIEQIYKPVKPLDCISLDIKIKKDGTIIYNHSKND